MKIVRTQLNMYTVIMAVGMFGLMMTAWSSPKQMPPLETPEQVADALDQVIQPRFQDDAGKFGFDRFLIQGHDNIYMLDNVKVPEMKKALRRVAASHRKYAISFLHCIHKPGNPASQPKGTIVDIIENEVHLETLIMPGNHYFDMSEDGNEKAMERQQKWEEAEQPRLQKAALKTLPELLKGNLMEANVGNWLVLMRPVRATKPSCLNCHKGAKTGDTLGVMVYSVSRTKEELKKKRIISL